ncbi:MAG: O-antigen ligase family protein [Bacteroidales bacterium]|nr:O-antigen ligase family protein [Candidatus Latescibacterota bacterium]
MNDQYCHVFEPDKRRQRIVCAFLFIVAVAAAAMLHRFDPRISFLLPAALILSLLLKNQSYMVFILVVFAFMRLDAWISSVFSLPFGKIMFLLSLSALASSFLFARSRPNRPTFPLLAWFIFILFSFAIGGIEASGEGVFLWISDTAYAATFFLVIYFLVNSRERLEKIIYLIAFIGVVTTAINIAEFIDPAGLGLSHSSGRAAGLLKNANTSAFIVNLSMVASIYSLRVVQRGWKVPLTVLLQVILFFGVFTTFSREGLLLYVLIFISQFFLIRQRSRKMLVAVLACTILVFGLIRVVAYIRDGADSDVRYSYRKISTLVNGDIDDNDRYDLLTYHLSRFAAKPLTGHGLYSALSYSIPRQGLSINEVPNGPHNTFVMILSETGIVPLVLYLVFLAALGWNIVFNGGVPGNNRDRAMRQCLLMLFISFLIHHGFSHMMLLSRYPMVLIALFALPAEVFSSGDRLVEEKMS